MQRQVYKERRANSNFALHPDPPALMQVARRAHGDQGLTC